MNKPKKHNAFELIYIKDGYYYGSYDLFPSDNDVKLLKVAVFKGFEKPEKEVVPVPTPEPTPVPVPVPSEEAEYLTSEAQEQLVEEELY